MNRKSLVFFLYVLFFSYQSYAMLQVPGKEFSQDNDQTKDKTIVTIPPYFNPGMKVRFARNNSSIQRYCDRKCANKNIKGVDFLYNIVSVEGQESELAYAIKNKELLKDDIEAAFINACKRGHSGLVRFLCQYMYDNDHYYGMICAQRYGQLPLVQLLTDMRKEPWGKISELKDFYNPQIIKIPARLNSVACNILRDGDDLHSVFVRACTIGHEELVFFLYNNYQAVDRSGLGLKYAMQNKHFFIVNLLYSNRNNGTVVDSGMYGHLAQHKEKLCYLLKNFPHLKEIYEQLLWYICSAQSSRFIDKQSRRDLITLLVNHHGLNCNYKMMRRTPLDEAAQWSIAVTNQLIDSKKVNIDIRNSGEGWSAGYTFFNLGQHLKKIIDPCQLNFFAQLSSDEQKKFLGKQLSCKLERHTFDLIENIKWYFQHNADFNYKDEALEMPVTYLYNKYMQECLNPKLSFQNKNYTQKLCHYVFQCTPFVSDAEICHRLCDNGLAKDVVKNIVWYFYQLPFITERDLAFFEKNHPDLYKYIQTEEDKEWLRNAIIEARVRRLGLKK